MSRVAGEKIRTLALDEGSRTSCALVQILLDRKFGVQPDCRSLAIEDDWRSVETDAVLIIGDRAMKASEPGFPFVWDLGETWNQWTGKPFVFAVWAARSDCDLDRLDRVLSLSRDRGVRDVEKISVEQAPLYGLSDVECLRYLRDNLHFHLGADEKSGLDLFLQMAAELLLIHQPFQLQFHDCQTAG